MDIIFDRSYYKSLTSNTCYTKYNLNLRGSDYMLELKVVRRGNSLALSLPANSDFKLHDTWLLIKKDNSAGYTLVPKLNNPFKNAKSGEFYTPEEWNENESEVE